MRLFVIACSMLLMACTDDQAPPAGSGGATGSGGGATTTSSGAGGAGGDGGSPAMGGSGGGAPMGVPLFVAQGHLARTTISCDDGQSWVAERSSDPSAECWSENNLPDCDHDPGAGRGITWGEGWFVATFGWGPPGGISRSRDGVAWQEVLSGTTFAGVAYGNGVFLAGDGVPQRSSDGGATWTELAPVGITDNARRFGFLEVAGGVFLLATDDGMWLSDDEGDSWWQPDSAPPGCGASIQTEGGIVAGDGVALVLGGDGLACRSSDGGKTFTATDLGVDIRSQLVWSGSAFMAWSSDALYTSPDGERWTSTPLASDVDIGAVAISPEGTLVAVRGGWQIWYDEQAFYRSQDGVSWQSLPAGSFTGGHPIRAMTFGWGDVSAECPGD